MKHCPACGVKLEIATKFCPECGARLPDDLFATPPANDQPAAPPADVAPISPPAPSVGATVLLPPESAPGATVLLPDARTPSAVPPTTRLDPAPGPDAPPAVAPTARLEEAPPPPRPVVEPTMIAPPTAPPLPPAAPPQWGAPPPAPPPQWGAPPAPPPPILSVPNTAPQNLPPGYMPPSAPPPPAQSRRNLWLILGGVGCLVLVLATVCVIGALTLLGNVVEESGIAQTAVALPTATGGGGIIPDDAPLAGGDVLLREEFDSSVLSNFTEDEDEDSRYSFEDGGYVIEAKTTEMLVWALTDDEYDDVVITCDSTALPGSETAAAGLIFRYVDDNNFYLFNVSTNGFYTLEALVDGEWEILIDQTQSDVIDAVNNQLQVALDGDRIALYVNGDLLEETSDDRFARGNVAISVNSFEDAPGIIRFDNLLIAENR